VKIKLEVQQLAAALSMIEQHTSSGFTVLCSQFADQPNGKR
jgi:hypothetical protein